MLPEKLNSVLLSVMLSWNRVEPEHERTDT